MITRKTFVCVQIQQICKSSYIPDSLYRTYTAHKDKNNIDVEFVMEQVAQH